MLNIDIITLFPELFEPFISNLPIKRATENNSLSIGIHHLRDFTKNKHKKVDGKTYGGGAGLILQIEPLYEALIYIYTKKYNELKKGLVLVTTPKGKILNQRLAEDWSKKEQITIICGRYEGIDHRIYEIPKLIKNTEVIPVSLGKFVLSGGEIPALAITESICRLLPNVILNEETLKNESFVEEGYLEYPQYSTPSDFRGLKVPDVLLSGHHKEIQKYRETNSEK